MQQHEPFFSFTVPANESSASENRSDDRRLAPVAQTDESNKTQSELTIVTQSQTDRSALPRSSSSESLSPTALGGRPGTANEFNFTFPSSSNADANEVTPTGATEHVSPGSSTPATFASVDDTARRDSRQSLTILTNNTSVKPNGRACFPSIVDPNSPADPRKDYSNHDIGTHNTRPMTAPGAGWDAGNYNHGYDYSSASAGLFGNAGSSFDLEHLSPLNFNDKAYHNSTSRTTANDTDGSNNTISTSTSPAMPESKSSDQPSKPSLQTLVTVNDPSSRKSSMNHSIPADQVQSNIVALPSQLTTPERHELTQQDQLMYQSTSPTLNNLSSDHATSGSPYLQSGSSQHHFHSVRPNTHAGTSAPFGERPDSSYGPPTPVHNGPASPFTLANYSTNSRPGTANASGSLPMYGSSYSTSRPSTSYGMPRLTIPGSNQANSSLTSPSSAYGHVGMLSNITDHSHGHIQQSGLPSANHHPSNLYGTMGSHGMGPAGIDPSDRMYNFNVLPVVPRKRARRRYDEIERLYSCSYPGCTKAYGTLNHLNAHIAMQKHGPKRLPQEFKEIRKEWRARKKAEAEARSAPYKHGHQTQKTQNHHHHHQTHSQFQPHQNHRVLSSSSSSTSSLVSPAGNSSTNTMGLMNAHSNSGGHYGNVGANRAHPMLSSGTSHPGSLMNLGQMPMGRVLSSGALGSPPLSTSMMSTHPGYGSDLLGPLPSSAPAYYASSHYGPPALGASVQYPPGSASAPRHSSMNYPTHLRANHGLMIDRNDPSDNLRSVSDNSQLSARSPHDLKQMMNADKKSTSNQYLVTATR